MRTLPLRTDFSPESFAPFGAVIERPLEAGERRYYSSWLGASSPACAPVFHTNRVQPTALPALVRRMERHPHAAQAFVPLSVDRYVVTVAASDDDGTVDTAQMEAFLVPGHLGVIYRPGVWHAGASVLGREGSFAVLMWRGEADDDIFVDIEPVTLAATPCRGAV